MTLIGTAGETIIRVAPDTATLILKISDRNKNKFVSRERVTKVQSKITAALDQISSVKYKKSWINENNCLDEHNKVFYNLNTTLSVIVDDLTQLEKIRNLVASAGGLASLDNISFEAKELSSLVRKARVTAIQVARSAAEDYASALGEVVLEVQSVSDPGVGQIYASDPALRISSTATERTEPLPEFQAPEEIKIRAAVNMTCISGPSSR